MAKELGVTRAAVWKHIIKLKQMGLNVFSVSGKGYKIPGGVDLLNKQWLVESIGSKFDSKVKLEVFNSIASTNQFLIDQSEPVKFHFCLSEYQYAGRGRLGRQWHSPFARNIYLSVKYKFPLLLDVSGLSLAVGIWVAELIEGMGCSEVKVKWPNDILINDRKVGGILTELSSAEVGSREVVIGLGLNWAMPDEVDVEQAWGNLGPMLNGISRNQMVLALIDKFILGLNEFEKGRKYSQLQNWSKFDFLRDKKISIKLGNRSINGNYKGINEQGFILVEADGNIEAYSGGEVSVRAVK